MLCCCCAVRLSTRIVIGPHTMRTAVVVQIALLMAVAVTVVSANLCLTQDGLAKIKSFESFQPKQYLDSANIPLIGYGTPCSKRTLSCPGPVSESAAATAFAKTVVSKFGKCLNAALLKTKTPALNNNQYSALVSFTFNAGCNSAESLLTTAAGDLAKLPKLMRSYNKAMFEGVKTIVHSLQVRRSAEIDLFNSKASSPCASLAGPTAFLETESDEAEEAEEAAEEEEETESEEEEEAEAEAEDESESESEEEEEVEAEEESEDESEDESEEAEDSEDSEEAESFVESGWYDKTRDPQYGPVSLPRVTGPVPPTPTNKPAPSSHAQIRDAERQSIAAASQPFPVHPQPKFAAPTGLAPSTDGSVAAEGEDTGRVNWVRDKSQIRRPRQLRLGKLKKSRAHKAVSADRQV